MWENMSYYTKEFSLFHRLTSHISKSLNFSYTSRRGLAKGLKRRGGLGFLPGGASSAEDEFLKTLDLRGKTVFDVGGFVGLMTIFFASRAARVVTYEPLPVSRSKILDNVKLNRFDNVNLRDVAVGAEPGELKIVYDDLMSGGASGDPEIGAELTGSAATPKSCVVPVTTIDLEIEAGQPVPDLVKIDVEGMEIAVLDGASDILTRFRPYLLIEHIKTDRKALATRLEALGYRVWVMGMNTLALPADDPCTDKIIQR